MSDEYTCVDKWEYNLLNKQTIYWVSSHCLDRKKLSQQWKVIIDWRVRMRVCVHERVTLQTSFLTLGLILFHTRLEHLIKEAVREQFIPLSYIYVK